MADIRTYLTDPEFHKLPASDQVSILDSSDPEFASLPASDKMTIIGQSQARVSPDGLLGGSGATLGVPAENKLYDPNTTPYNIYPPETPLTPTSSKTGIPKPDISAAFRRTAVGTGLMVGAGAGEGGASVATAALGASAGEAAADLFDRFLGVKAPLPNVSSGVEEAGKNMASGLGEAATQEVTGNLINPFISKVAEGIAAPYASGRLVGGPERMQGIIDKAKESGISLTPEQITNEPTLTFFEKLFKMNPLTSGKVKGIELGQIEQRIAARNKLLNEYGPKDGATVEKLGSEIQDMVDSLVKKEKLNTSEQATVLKDAVLKRAGSPESFYQLGQPASEITLRIRQGLESETNNIYKQAKSLVPEEANIDPSEFRKSLLDAKKQIDLAPAVDSDKKKVSNIINAYLRDVSPSIPADVQYMMDAAPTQEGRDRIYQAALDAGQIEVPNKTYAQLDAIRQDLGRLKYDYTKPDGSVDQFGKIFGDLKRSVSSPQGGEAIGDMDRLVEQIGDPNISILHNLARESYIKSENFKSDPIVQALTVSLKKDPGQVLEATFKPGNDGLINRTRDIVGPDIFKAAQANKLVDLFSVPEGKELTGQIVRNRLTDWGSTAKTLWGDKTLQDIVDFSNALDGVRGMGAEIYNNPVFEKVLKSDNLSDIIDKIVTPGEVGQVNLIRQRFGQSGIDKVGQAFLPKILMQDQNGAFNPATAQKVLDQYGDKTLEAIYGKEILSNIKDTIEIAKKSQPVISEGAIAQPWVRRLLMYGGAGSAMAGLVLHPAATVGTGVGIAITSKAMAEMYYSPLGRKLLTEGLTINPLSPAAKELTGKIISMVAGYTAGGIGRNDKKR